jgi:tetratricopeptide (TPR) repeat protein
MTPELFPSPQVRSSRSVLAALRARRSDVVELATRHRAMFPADRNGTWVGAEAAAQQGQHAAAIALYLQMPRDGGRAEFQRELGLGQRYFALGNLVESERHLRQALTLDPFHLEANNRLGHLLQVCGRSWESTPFFLTQIQRGKCRGDELLAAAVSDRFFRLDERLERTSVAPGSGGLPIRLAEARRAIFENREVEAERLLREILALHPEIGEAQGRLGRMIADRGDTAEFLRWRGSLSDEAHRHPEVLFAEGIKARRLGQVRGAAHCFLAALQLAPNHLGVHVQLAGCLEQLGMSDLSQSYSRRAQLLSEFDRNVNLLRETFDEEVVLKTIAMLGEMQRNWEAAGWSFVLTNLDEPSARSRREMACYFGRIRQRPAQPMQPGLSPASLDPADFPPPRWPMADAEISPAIHSEDQAVAWNFSDDAESLGIRFQYYEGTERSNRLTHIFNTVGGGLGAIDYDGDGWIDLYLPQANNWRETAAQPDWIDRLYRNVDGEHFDDTTRLAGLKETGFSHGVNVGDYDQDGFQDLYVGNLGPNTLHRNNGDGTFTDATAEAGIAGNEWSTSSVFCDVSGDGLPDLYVVNYSLLKETAEKVCQDGQTGMMACTPDVLQAEQDRLYINLGDGHFRDVSAESGIQTPGGKGLGVVAWDFAGDGRLSLYVANDTSPSFLLVNEARAADGVPQFSEHGFSRGVAVDQDGNAQASMGVAAGDANGDGRLDLFVTTFFGDSDTLFVAQEGGFFTDSTRLFQLRDPGYWMLGFGCQFADFDGDRWEDLVVTNGHVDQVSANGTEDLMRPQLYRNVRGQRFEEVSANRLGPFFEGKYLGRGLATFDWNRDGRPDVGISHLHSPLAVLTNKTPCRSRPLAVRLAGRRGCRDAVGATLMARVGHEVTYRFLTAGNGFLVSNQRVMNVGWPGVQTFDELTVRWPDLHEQTWKNVVTGQEILLIEDQSDPIVLHTFPLPPPVTID